MLAVQSVPIEKDEVRAGRSIDLFVDPKKVLDRSTGATLRARVERSDPNYSSGFAERGLASCNAPRAPRGLRTARLLFVPRHRPRFSFAAPPLLDFRHATTDNQLQM
jgi:hypothetical protein